MKGLFIPEITAEMFKSGCLEIIEALMAVGEIYDIEYQQWIPCSERLPEKPNVYTVTDSNDRVVRFVFTGTDSSREYWKRCAKAWMPLPEPYKEDDHETG